MSAAIEIYNKPGIEYRDEITVMLMVNAWELSLKSLLSKHGQSIYYPKKRGNPYKTLTWQDAIDRAEPHYPTQLPLLPVKHNLELLSTFRNNAVHFYNAKRFRVLLYGLSQTCVINFRDFLHHSFGADLGQDITWALMPIGIAQPIDPIEYISSQSTASERGGEAVNQFLIALSRAHQDVLDAGLDTGRLLTKYQIKLESMKKLANADLVVGVTRAENAEQILNVEKPIDPNRTHPLRQKDVIQRIGELHERKFTGYIFQSILWQYGLKQNTNLCWQADEGVLVKYSNDIIQFIRRLTLEAVNEAATAYRDHLRSRSKAEGQVAAAAS